MLACVSMETGMLRNRYYVKVFSHVFCRKARSQSFAMLSLEVTFNSKYSWKMLKIENRGCHRNVSEKLKKNCMLFC